MHDDYYFTIQIICEEQNMINLEQNAVDNHDGMPYTVHHSEFDHLDH